MPILQSRPQILGCSCRPRPGKAEARRRRRTMPTFWCSVIFLFRHVVFHACARQVKRGPKYLEKLSSKFGWRPRADAWNLRQAEIRAEQQQQAAREKQELQMKRQQDLIEEKFQVGQELIEKGRAILKLPSTDRVIERGDASKVVLRASRSAKAPVELIRLGFELKSQSLAEDLAQNSQFEETNDYTIDPFSPTQASSKPDDPPPGPTEPGEVP